MISIVENKVDNPCAQVIFAHGAGADMHHEFMVQVTALFNLANINVLRFNFPFMDKRIALGKRYPPDRMPKLLDCYHQVIEDYLRMNKTSVDIPLLIGGKSMGSRVAATIAGDEIIKSIKGVFCFGYPFHPPKKIDKLRLEPLQETKKPIIILQGERDTLGTQIEVSTYQTSDLCQYVFFPDGDHSLKPRVKSGFTQQQHMKSAVTAIAKFIQETITND